MLRADGNVSSVELDRVREPRRPRPTRLRRPVVAAEDRLGQRLRLRRPRPAPRSSPSSTPASTPRIPTSPASSSPGAVDPRRLRRTTDPNGHGTAMAGIIAARRTTRPASPASATRASRSCPSPSSTRTAWARTATSSRASCGRRPRRRRHQHELLEPGLLPVAPGRHRLRLGQRRRRRRGDRQRRVSAATFPAGDRRRRRLEHGPDDALNRRPTTAPTRSWARPGPTSSR